MTPEPPLPASATPSSQPVPLGVSARNSPANDGVLSPIFAASTRAVLPVITLVSLIVMLMGHNKPGGGFVGGLILSAGIVLNALAFGAASSRRLLVVHPITLTAFGLSVALLSALASPSVGFFHAVWMGVELPGLGALKIGTPVLFDAGVFLVVVGGCSLMNLTLLEQE